MIPAVLKRTEKRSLLCKTLFHSLALSLFTISVSFAQTTVYQDVPYIQDYSVKYYVADSTVRLKRVFADRNGVIQVLSSKGLLRPQAGQFQYPERSKLIARIDPWLIEKSRPWDFVKINSFTSITTRF